MALDRKKATLSTGQTVWYEYDRDTDLLEIIFQPAEATCAVELTESLVLRFDWETNVPLSLSVISFSKLLQPAEYGIIHFQLLNREWPEEAQPKIWTMLKQPPLTDFLELSSYAPAHTPGIIPMTSIKQSSLLLQAA